jgi:hypothetical protein
MSEMRIRHTSAYISIRQHTSFEKELRADVGREQSQLPCDLDTLVIRFFFFTCSAASSARMSGENCRRAMSIRCTVAYSSSFSLSSLQRRCASRSCGEKKKSMSAASKAWQRLVKFELFAQLVAAALRVAQLRELIC